MELAAFVRTALNRDIRRRADYLLYWQTRLQALCSQHEFPCRIWQECVYTLDLRLQIEVEGFVRAVLSSHQRPSNSLTVLRAWQASLQRRCQDFCFPCRFWRDFVYDCDLVEEN